MKKLFSIGEMAKLYGMNPKSIRYYEQVGLIKPAEINPITKYRYYSTKQFEILNCILSLRTLDVPVSEIKRFMGHKTTEDIQLLLLNQLKEVEEMKRNLHQCEERLKLRIKYLENTIHSQLDTIIECSFPEREIAWNEEKITLEEDIEYPLREIGGENPHDFPIFLGKVGYIINTNSFLKLQSGIYEGVFLFLEKGDVCNGTYRILPEGKYLTIRFNGTHMQASPYYQKLINYIVKKGYKITGDILEISLMDHCLTDDTSQYVTEIQLPYKIN